MSSRVLIDHRRHSMRGKPGEHLNQRGVELARRVGAGEFGPTPRYDFVATSPSPRAFETALAMGWAVHEQLDRLWMGDVADDVPWPLEFEAYPDLIRARPRLAEFVGDLARLFHSVASRVPAGGAALVVSHGGVVELSALALLPDSSHDALRRPIGYAEGVRLTFDDGQCVRSEPLRVGADD